MASPSMTENVLDNIVAAGTSIAASGTSSAVPVDVTTKFELQIQFDVLTGGTAQAAGTYTVKWYRVFGTSTKRTDTGPVSQAQFNTGTPSQHFINSIALPTGRWSITITNGDTANAVTFGITSSTVDSIA